MADLLMAHRNGRRIPKEDLIFSIGNRANAAIAERGKEPIVNATIGMLLDDDGELLVLSSVDKTFKTLGPEDYAPYAPIAGTEGFKKAIIKSCLKHYEPKGFPVAVASPGGTGAIRLAVSNYSRSGDQILTTDWHWGPYGKIAGELRRGLSEFKLFDENNKFNGEDFDREVKRLINLQDSLLVILNTPAQNPTGYSLDAEDWAMVKKTFEDVPRDKQITLLVDTAYIDFAGDEDEVRNFLPLIEDMPEHVMPLVAFSLSKTFTIYGMRVGALICLARTEEVAEEFSSVAEYSARASWSNSPLVGQKLIEKIYADEELLEAVTKERAEIRDMLFNRAKVFIEEADKVGLEMLPYCGGFFIVIPCDKPKLVGEMLEDKGIFTIPFGQGIRVSIAAVPVRKIYQIPIAAKHAIEASWE